MAWSGVITNNGRNMISQLSGGGHVLTITRATVGSGYVSSADAIRAATALQSEKDSASIVSKKEGTNFVTIRVRVNPDTSGGYIAHEVGLWAKVDDGTEKLFALHQDTGNGVPVPDAGTDPQFAFSLWMSHAMFNYTAGTIQIEMDLEAYAKIEDIEDASDGLMEKTIGSSLDGKIALFDGNGGRKLKTSEYQLLKTVPANAVFTDTDTKNTAGSTNSTSKLFLIGATSQGDSPQTYSRSTCYIGTDGCLYSNGTKVSTTDTKNTAGSTNLSGEKLYLIGAQSQAASAQTYSRSNCYIDSVNGLIYSAGYKTVTKMTSSSSTLSYDFTYALMLLRCSAHMVIAFVHYTSNYFRVLYLYGMNAGSSHNAAVNCAYGQTVKIGDTTGTYYWTFSTVNSKQTVTSNGGSGQIVAISIDTAK